MTSHLSNQRGWTALMISAYNGLIEIVKLLLQKGADPRIEDSFGKKPADRAKDPKIIKLLNDAIDEFTLGGVPLPAQQRNSSPPGRGKTPMRLTTDDDGVYSSATKAKRNMSAGMPSAQSAFTSTYTSNFETKTLKEVESATQMKQLAAQLVAQSQTVL